MDNIPYTYAQIKAPLNLQFPDRKSLVLFRQHEGVIEVQVVREQMVNESRQSFKRHMKGMEKLARGLKEVTIETKIRATNEYGYEEPEATYIVKGWTSHFTNAHKRMIEHGLVFQDRPIHFFR